MVRWGCWSDSEVDRPLRPVGGRLLVPGRVVDAVVGLLLLFGSFMICVMNYVSIVFAHK